MTPCDQLEIVIKPDHGHCEENYQGRAHHLETDHFPLETFVELKSVFLDGFSKNVNCLSLSFFYSEHIVSVDIVEEGGIDDVEVARRDKYTEKTVEPDGIVFYGKVSIIFK